MKSNREARLQRQAVVGDDFEKFLAIATAGNREKPNDCDSQVPIPKQRRQSHLLPESVPHFGGSLPSFHVHNKSPSPIGEDFDECCPDNSLLLATHEGDKVRLSVPASPMIQRSHSDGDCSPFFATTPSKPLGKFSQNKFFNNVKTLLESCDITKSSCISPPTSPPHSLDLPKCCTAPHSRSSSFKRKKLKDATIKKDAEIMTERTSSMPAINKKADQSKRPSQFGLNNRVYLQPSTSAESDEWERVRNFVTSPRGIFNCGDSFRRSTSSLRSMGSWGSGSHGSEDYGYLLGLPSHVAGYNRSVGSFDGGIAVPHHRVLILGGPGVGKTTLAQQFATSDSLVNVESIGEFEDCVTVRVLLNEEESRVDILEIPYNHDYKHIDVDAYIIIYASTDRTSFHHAVDLLYELCKQDAVQRPVILVANKSDLVRAREIAEQEGKSAAVTYNCKYFEVSSLMNLKVDELLAGMINQIRLHSLTSSQGGGGGGGGGSQWWGSNKKLSKTNQTHHQPVPLVDKIFNRPKRCLRRQGSKSCDNLLVM